MNLSLAPGGKRFATLPVPEAAGPDKGSVQVTFLLNFFDELRRRTETWEALTPARFARTEPCFVNLIVGLIDPKYWNGK